MTKNIKTKNCPTCNILQSSDCFTSAKNRRDGLQWNCKKCAKEYQELHKEEISAHNKQYRMLNKDHISDISKKYRALNRDNLNENKKQYYYSNKEVVLEKLKDKHRVNPALKMIVTARRRAKLKNIPFNLEAEDILIPSVCPILKIPIIPGVKKLHKGSPSLDRITPEIGYTPTNIQILSHKANCMKQDLNVNQLLLFANWINNTYSCDNISNEKQEYMPCGIEGVMLSRAKSRAKEKGLPFNLELCDIIVPLFCPVFKTRMKVGIGCVTAISPSLDRIIPEKGYTKGNIQVISHKANACKQNATSEELLLFSDWVFRTYTIKNYSK